MATILLLNLLVETPVQHFRNAPLPEENFFSAELGVKLQPLLSSCRRKDPLGGRW